MDIKRGIATLYDMVKRIVATRLAITAWRIAMLYIAMNICRAVFYFYNQELIGEIASDEIWQLFKGSILFDSASFAYTMSLYFIITLLPVSERIWNKKWYRVTTLCSYIIPAGAMLAINLSDVVYFHYTQRRFTSEEIFFADNSNTPQLMLQFLQENWYLALIWVVLIAALVIGFRVGFKVRDIVPMPTRHKDDANSESWHSRRMVILTSLFVLVRLAVITAVIFYCAYAIRGGLTRMTQRLNLSHSMLYTKSPHKANLILSNPFCIIRTMDHHIVVPHFFDDKEIDAIYTPSHYPEDMMRSELYGACEGYNVVLFILESFSAEHSAYLMPEEHSNGGYTPNLDKLMAKGLVFDHCYSNGYVSIAAPPAIWSSTPSYEVSFLRMAESVADCRPLPRILADKGYHTAFFCGSEHGSMGFGAYAHIAGIDELYSMEDYEERHGSGDFDDAWGIWDEPFIDYMGEEISDFKEPFFASIFTLTSHHPFNVPEEVEDELPKGTTLNHRPIAYADRAIGRFMEKYRNEEWFQRTLFIFVADHVSSERMLEKTNSLPECFHIIGFMYTPDGAIPAQHYEHIFSHVDIMPTVLGLVGHDEPYFAIGRDIFNEPQREPFTLIRSGYQYLGLMDDYFIDFDGTSCFGAYSYDDYEHSNDISSTIEIGRADSLTKATLQQYYMHVSQRNYFPKERK